jgi:hypothetical protein
MPPADLKGKRLGGRASGALTLSLSLAIALLLELQDKRQSFGHFAILVTFQGPH